MYDSISVVADASYDFDDSELHKAKRGLRVLKTLQQVVGHHRSLNVATRLIVEDGHNVPLDLLALKFEGDLVG